MTKTERNRSKLLAGVKVAGVATRVVSGHSTFIAAAAEILKRFTGSDYFGGSVTPERGISKVEPGFDAPYGHNSYVANLHGRCRPGGHVPGAIAASISNREISLAER